MSPDVMQTAPDPTEPPRRPIDIKALTDFLASIGSYVDEGLILKPDKDLFHYTTLDGFLSILKNGDLWLTDSRYCNDEEEREAYHLVDEIEQKEKEANDSGTGAEGSLAQIDGEHHGQGSTDLV